MIKIKEKERKQKEKTVAAAIVTVIMLVAVIEVAPNSVSNRREMKTKDPRSNLQVPIMS